MDVMDVMTRVIINYEQRGQGGQGGGEKGKEEEEVEVREARRLSAPMFNVFTTSVSATLSSYMHVTGRL